MSTELIAEARGFIEGSDPNNARTTLIRDLADALEKAHTPSAPTDDEREALAQALHNAVEEIYPVSLSVRRDRYYAQADVVLAAGFRRTSVPEPSAHCDGCAKFQHHHCYHCGKRAGLSHPMYCPNFTKDDPIAAHGRELRRKYGDDVTVPGGTRVTDQGEEKNA
ncbi:MULTISPECIES: hypothetical protein [unclassified Microbacterium]|uniref:hypothetical protein n=1 Tax=unclassified Microbacterium TaxID=2609290 RepID=UPI001603B774|nr:MULTISPECIES: hypothetical protein [unclassified Microbacterium]MBT2484817.1 hypothetical protein [Microbacterium sp. ISL-108]